MKLDLYRKIIGIDALTELSDQLRAEGKTIVHCHGCFDIVHPGHVRYLQFARQQGDSLVVSLTGDDAIEKEDGTRPYIPQELRAENLAALEFVDHVVIADGPTAEPILAALRPHLYIKGKEYEHSTHPGFLAEQQRVEEAGGRVIFSSGQVVFSSTKLITDHITTAAENLHDTTRLGACCARWGVDANRLRSLVTEQFKGKRIAVIGDCLADRYIECEHNDVAGEAPILSVRPVRQTTYLGGAAIVAAHLKALGAEPHLVTTVARDDASREMTDTLDARRITQSLFDSHRALPTKLRYIVDKQKLLKIDQGQPQPIDSQTERRMLALLHDLRHEIDAAIFLDFGYGTLSIPLLAQAMPVLRPHVRTITGDVSGPRRTLLAMNEADLLTPTERELRAVVGDFEESLPAVAMRVMRQLKTANLIVTMDQRGCVLFRPREDERANWFNSRLRSDYLPALNDRPLDLVGAGDALLSAATLALSCDTPLPVAGYLGSVAAAIAIDRLGNLPVTADELLTDLADRGELQTASATQAG